jgi:hypothetical protein
MTPTVGLCAREQVPAGLVWAGARRPRREDTGHATGGRGCKAGGGTARGEGCIREWGAASVPRGAVVQRCGGPPCGPLDALCRHEAAHQQAGGHRVVVCDWRGGERGMGNGATPGVVVRCKAELVWRGAGDAQVC